MPSSVSPDVYREQRYREGKFTCDICLDPWPMSHLREQRGPIGSTITLRVGVKCCYEPAGDETDRDQRRAFAAKMAAHLSVNKPGKELRPPVGPSGKPYPGVTPYAPDVWITTLTPNPLVLTRGGAAGVLSVLGGGFSSSDTFSYSTGISDAASPFLSSDDLWTLTVHASGGAPVGVHPMTFNSTNLWQSVFDVR